MLTKRSTSTQNKIEFNFGGKLQLTKTVARHSLYNTYNYTNTDSQRARLELTYCKPFIKSKLVSWDDLMLLIQNRISHNHLSLSAFLLRFLVFKSSNSVIFYLYGRYQLTVLKQGHNAKTSTIYLLISIKCLLSLGRFRLNVESATCLYKSQFAFDFVTIVFRLFRCSIRSRSKFNRMLKQHLLQQFKLVPLERNVGGFKNYFYL